MDAVKFIKERNRMCATQGHCASCPATDCECSLLEDMVVDTSIVTIVEKWSKEHPQHKHKTRQDTFLKQWPSASLDSCGILTLCPKHLYCDFSCTDKNDTETPKRCKNCTTCRHEFWMQEIK